MLLVKSSEKYANWNKNGYYMSPWPISKAKLIGYSTNYFPKNKMLVKINMYAECSLQEKKHP